MRSPIRKNLIATFRREFEAQYPQFSRVKLKSGESALWEWRLTRRLSLFVMLDTFPQDERFVLEIAWSEDGEFPWDDFGGDLKVDAPSWRDRLKCLWSDEEAWDLEPERKQRYEAAWKAYERDEIPPFPVDVPVDIVIARIEPMVDECLQKLHQYGIPIFRRVAKRRKIPVEL